ncbi:hypothetical protein VFPPC_06865 [Pochonia chlamydosporia 170]|uniref:Uncharacterized protein n=1 Tax=Pochonia chlamydosporia 170 TaxID=1380566 RepID=A0A179F610_METCM|nr:hypothetical protein VFPPC_06865 [Pochonia chlamydosporia 170]OAQ60771.1 hypothetical protein VFPPC_06865 [Pochonia chlamydosporia 170]
MGYSAYARLPSPSLNNLPRLTNLEKLAKNQSTIRDCAYEHPRFHLDFPSFPYFPVDGKMGLRVSDADEEDVDSMDSLLLVDEKQFSHPKRSRRCNIQSDASLVIIGVCLGFILTGSIYLMISFGKQSHPRLALISVQFSKNDDFQNISHSHDQNWENLLTENNGFFFEKNRKTGQMEAFGISMFHQLHCLTILRTGLQKQTLANELAHQTTEAHESRNDRYSAAELPHLLHCMDYLRQVRRLVIL